MSGRRFSERFIRTKRKADEGFTLVEAVLAALILVVAILTTAFSILNLQDMSELSREKIVAVADAHRVLEAMRHTANSSLSALQSTNWSTWAAANVITTKSGDEIRLNQENISVTFSGTNPVQAMLVLTWNHRGHTYAYQIITLMTDRG